MMYAEWDLARFMHDAEHMKHHVNEENTGTTFEPVTPEIPSLYLKFIKEEYKELLEAVEKGQDDKILNEAMDLIWVTIGYCVAKKYACDGAWQALAKANMAKLQKDPITGALLRREDGKILKPVDWKPADFTPFVNGGSSWE